MSKADVLLPQERLPCSPTPKSPTPPTLSELVRLQKPRTNGFHVDNEKQAVFDNACNGKDPCQAQTRKKKHRRGKRRKWRPYSRFSWDEKGEVDERDFRRTSKIRAGMSSVGLTLAPFNTTQFLMEDHNVQEPDYSHIPHKQREHSTSLDSSDDYYSSPEDEEDFLHRQFIETYENVHIERLDSMTKTELVQELMCVEDKVESLEKSLHDEKLRGESNERKVQASDQDLESQLEKIRVFKAEIQKLADENDRLRRENEELRNRSSVSHVLPMDT